MHFFNSMPYQVTKEKRQHPKEAEESSTTEQKEEVNAASPTRRMVKSTLLNFQYFVFRFGGGGRQHNRKEGSTTHRGEE